MPSNLRRITGMNDISKVASMGFRIGNLRERFHESGPGWYYHRGKGKWAKYSEARDFAVTHGTPRGMKPGDYEKATAHMHDVKYVHGKKK